MPRSSRRRAIFSLSSTESESPSRWVPSRSVVSYNTKSIVTSSKTASRLRERPRGTGESGWLSRTSGRRLLGGAANRDHANQRADASVVRHGPRILIPGRDASTPSPHPGTRNSAQGSVSRWHNLTISDTNREHHLVHCVVYNVQVLHETLDSTA